MQGPNTWELEVYDHGVWTTKRIVRARLVTDSVWECLVRDDDGNLFYYYYM